MKTLWYFRMPGATHTVTQYYIPEEDLHLKQQKHCENSRQNLWHFHTWYPGVLLHEVWTNLKCFRKFDKSHFYFQKVIFNIFFLFVTCMNLMACLTCTHPSAMGICGLWCLRGIWHFDMGLWPEVACAFCHEFVWSAVLRGMWHSAMGLCGLRCLRGTQPSARQLCGLWCLRDTWSSVVGLYNLWCLRGTQPTAMGLCGLWCWRGMWPSAMGLCGMWCLRGTQPSAIVLSGLWCLRGTWSSARPLCNLWC